MGSTFDDMKGRAKEAAGDLADDDKLKREGKADQAGAKVKEVAENAKEKVDTRRRGGQGEDRQALSCFREVRGRSGGRPLTSRRRQVNVR